MLNDEQNIKLVIICASAADKTSLYGQYKNTIRDHLSSNMGRSPSSSLHTFHLPPHAIGYRRLLLHLLRILPRCQRTRDFARAHEMLRGIQAPSAGDEEADNFRCVVVGNKMDLLQPGMDATAHKFVQGLVPVSQPELSGRVEEEIVAEDIISGGNDFRARIHL